MGDKSRERKYRIDVILFSIRKANSNDKIVSEEKLILEIVKNFNVSPRTAKIYLNELELKRAIVRYAGEVWDKDFWDKAGNILTEKLTLEDPEDKLMETERRKRLKEEGLIDDGDAERT